MMLARSAMTLLEVLVTLTILAIVTSVATLALRPQERRRASIRALLDDSLAVSIAQGRRIVIDATVDGRRVIATINADGSILADSETTPRGASDPIDGR